MNIQQIKAIDNLRVALNRIGKVGLCGGIYDGTFWVFTDSSDKGYVIGVDDKYEDTERKWLNTPHVDLDGGAGA